ncbi:cyanophycinase [Clostridium thermosuccinogenes]|jgi:cyanophycinase|uniref:Cyanophycinase n=1 Tax=Clostridium thermosuccinogenes TaxID=84032 RepID=A0A2K2FQA0_9CLOT|nr:cyanophycinase [Pseudoclostridium thermosuccinogenes]AUS95128.1 cyanophycinase [Pseudoclostridium thermosuccinogenes]PNT91492.1 cyanophycinase [Pseudoclostridium thermosuccinogenes]PNT99152.1 cyanophycinase [Pseudoclostridium thermosuccinogenes]PNU00955.1 cyanophycinase [Pseudoclostridium thermosuccinogenes]
MDEKVKGNLIIIGGAEDKYGESKILKQVVEVAGGADASIMVLTTATEKPMEVGNEYKRVFERLGVKNIEILDISSRTEADRDDYAQRIGKCTGIFFTGGDQLRITSILGGTKVHQALQDAHLKGAAIIGTSAGASVMSATMIVDGDNNEPARKCTLKMAPGLGLLEGAIIDQHFEQRGRIGRLLCGVAENPYILGIGIDEDTAIQVFPDAHLEVLGTNAVTIIDGTSIKNSNVSELKPDEILAITNVTLHVLPRGYGFDMKNRKVLTYDEIKG